MCHGMGYVRNDAQPGEPGFGRLTHCQCVRAQLDAMRFERLLQISGMLAEELELRLSDVIARGKDTPAMAEQARRFIADPWGFLTLWGGYGTGKTLILQAVVNEMRITHNWLGAYVRMKDLLDYVRAGYHKDAKLDAQQRYEELRDIPVLAIDECDAARMTDYAYEFRAAFFDDRYRLAVARKAHTILAMNCPPQELPGDIYDRLRDGRFVIFHNADQSMRPAMGG